MSMSQPPNRHRGCLPSLQVLPTELRLMIWKFAALAPRYLELYTDFRTRRSINYVGRTQPTVCGHIWKRRGAQPPALLSICRKSGNEVLVRYDNPGFVERLEKPSLHYFNSTSTLSVPQGDLGMDVPGLLILEMIFGGKIKTLAIIARDSSGYGRYGILNGSWDILSTLKGLTEIQVICGERRPAGAAGFKELKDLNRKSGESITQGLFEKEIERMRLRFKEKDGEWEIPEVRYDSFEYREIRELIPKVKQTFKGGRRRAVLRKG